MSDWILPVLISSADKAASRLVRLAQQISIDVIDMMKDVTSLTAWHGACNVI